MSTNDLEAQYRLLFEGSPICQFIEDYSEIKKYLDKLPIKKTRREFEKYFQENPEEIEHVIKMAKIIDLNRGAVDLFEANSKSELKGSLGAITGEATYDVFKDEILAFYFGKKVFQAEAINYTLSGKELQILFRAAIVPGFEDSLKRIIVSIIDLTDLKTTEKALKSSEERYQALFNSVPIGIGIATYDGRLLEYNKSMLDIMGLDINNVKTINVKEFYINPTDRENILNKLQRTGKIRNEEYMLRRNDGQIIPVLVNMDLFHFEGEDVVFSAFIDNTEVYNYRQELEHRVRTRTIDLEQSNLELKIINEKLLQKSSELEEFVYTISHDLKSPLLSIVGFTYLIRTKIQEELDEELNEFFDRIKHNTTRMEKIIEEILEYSRIGRIVESKSYYTLTEILEEVLKTFTPRLKADNIKLDIQNNLPRVYAVKKQILLVFQNLIDNAIKFMDPEKPEKEIKIGMEGEDEKFITISVEDNGIGIREEDFSKLFRVFTRISDPRTEHITGSGIGLANVKKILETCGGDVWVESILNEGSTFYLKLPKLDLEI